MAKETKSCSGANRKLNLTYMYADYVVGDGTYIVALEDDEPYADVTVSLHSYGIDPEENQIVMPTYKMLPEFIETLQADLVKRVIRRIEYGPYDAYGLLVELKDDWKERCKPLS